MTRELFPEKSLSPALPKGPYISHVPGEIPQGAAAAKPSTFCLDEQLLKVRGSRSAGGHLSADLLQLALHPAAARLKGVLGGNGLQHRVRDVHLQTQGPHINMPKHIGSADESVMLLPSFRKSKTSMHEAEQESREENRGAPGGDKGADSKMPMRVSTLKPLCIPSVTESVTQSLTQRRMGTLSG